MLNNITSLLHGKKYYYTLLISIFLNFIIVYTIWLLLFSSTKNKKNELLEKINTIELTTIENKANIKKMRAKVIKVKKSYDNISDSYYSYNEIDSFYRQLSHLASIYSLTIKNLEKNELLENKNTKDHKSVGNNITFFKFSYLLEGEFQKYLSLREELSNIKEKILIINEKVRRMDNTKQGVVQINAILHIPTIKDIIKSD